MNYRRFFTITATAIFILSFVAFSVFGRSFSFPRAHALDSTNALLVYDGDLASGWNNWSWNSSVDLHSSSPSYQNHSAIAFTPSPWGGLYFHSDTAIDTGDFSKLDITLFASLPGQKFSVIFFDMNNQALNTPLPLSQYGGDLTVNNWKQYVLPLADANIPNNRIRGFAIQDISGNLQPTLSVGEVAFEKNQTSDVNTASQVVYGDALATGWVNWSWNSAIDFNSTNAQYHGTNDISFTPTSAWGGLYLHTDTPVDGTKFSALHFAARATENGQKFAVMAYGAYDQLLRDPVLLDSYHPLTTNWQEYTIPLSDMHANMAIKGIGIYDLSGHAQPPLYLNDIRFDNGTNAASPSISPVPTLSIAPSAVNSSATVSPIPTGEAIPTTTSGYTTRANTILKDGTSIQLHGVSWFGFETGTHALHGLWAVNWKDSIAQMKGLGFNSVRIPFCPDTLHNVQTQGVDGKINPDLATLKSLDLLDKVMGELNNQHIYILLDHHTPDCNAISNLWYTGSYSQEQWIKDLQFVANRYKGLEYFIGIDLKNEPHGNATWGTGNAATDWNTAAENAGKAVLAANPNILVFVQGVQDNPTCSNNSIGHWQGGNLEPENCTPLSVSMIPANRLVLSPHVYGPDVWMQSYFSDNNFPNNMPSIWDTQFGNLVNKGMTIVPGEWGGKDGTNGGNAKDPVLEVALTNYFSQKHICNSFYWDWNPNSGDTGGILQDDWKTVWAQKMELLNTYYTNCMR